MPADELGIDEAAMHGPHVPGYAGENTCHDKGR